MSVFEITGGRVAMYLCFLKRYVNTAPIRVARLPNTISGNRHPVRIFETMQPIKSPGIAEGKKIGKTQSASESLS